MNRIKLKEELTKIVSFITEQIKKDPESSIEQIIEKLNLIPPDDDVSDFGCSIREFLSEIIKTEIKKENIEEHINVFLGSSLSLFETY